MNTKKSTNALLSLVLPAAVMLFVSACDSGSSTARQDCSQVAGRYDFTRFEFVAQASAVQDKLGPFSYLDTLDADRTELWLVDSKPGTTSCQYLLSYGYKEGDEGFVQGNYAVNRDGVVLSVPSGSLDLAKLNLNRGSIVLRQTSRMSDLFGEYFVAATDLSNIKPGFEGFQKVDGTMYLTLKRK